MRIINLTEAVDENHLYHYTDLNGLIGIINSNKMYGNIETKGILQGKTTVSFSRIGAGKTSDKHMTSMKFKYKDLNNYTQVCLFIL